MDRSVPCLFLSGFALIAVSPDEATHRFSTDRYWATSRTPQAHSSPAPTSSSPTRTPA